MQVDCQDAKDGAASDRSVAELPLELRLRILSHLPPNDLALGGRLACKELAARFAHPQHHCTVHLGQQLPPYAAAPLEAALRHWTLRQKLGLLVGAAKCGREDNVEVVLGVLEHQLFPELLSSDHYYATLPPKRMYDVPSREIEEDVGSAAVAGGLAHLLPSLEQRCPGLLDPGRTLEAAARRCDLAGLQAAWGLLEGRLEQSLQQPGSYGSKEETGERRQGVWRRILAAAAASTTSDALQKLQWVNKKRPRTKPVDYLTRAHVCSAAAASGDMARLHWLRERGFQKHHQNATLELIMEQADLPFIQRMDQEGGYLPPAGHLLWREGAITGAAVAPRDSAAKLRWLAARGVPLHVGFVAEQVILAARCGNLEALQLLLQGRDAEYRARLLEEALQGAVAGGCIPTAAWLLQEGTEFWDSYFESAARRGDLPLVRWLLEAGCPWASLSLVRVVRGWPSSTCQDAGRLVEAVRLLAAAGWPLTEAGAPHPLVVAARVGHPWPVWQALRELMPEDERAVPYNAAEAAAATGCEVTLEALVGLGVCEEHGAGLARAWYAAAARNGDLGTLSCLVRLGVPLGEGVLAAAVREGAPLCALQWLVGQGAPVVEAEVREVLGVLGAAYTAAREQERQGVDTWLRGLL